ncbi:hypothetical protein AB0N06_14180 [Streptomyces sp. NPDC051020]|uniref:hypothetical protein n=1 Tax=Streptomyces sp. NPDC051020 TaxID=3155409 RepID=UPI003416A92D
MHDLAGVGLPLRDLRGVEQGPGTKAVWCELPGGGDHTSHGEPFAVIRVDSAGMSVGVIAR